MATAPAVSFKPLGPQTEPRMQAHHVICLHTMVGYLSSTDRYFRATNGAGYAGTESHYGIGGQWGGDAGAGLDGTIWQWQDLHYQADANLAGGVDVISIETADNAPKLAKDISPWTDAQVKSIIALTAWLCSKQAHANCPETWLCARQGIPARLIPDTRPGIRGIGYHRQGIDPWRVPNGRTWSSARGKECPGNARISQISGVIIPGVNAILSGAAKPVTAPVAPKPPPKRPTTARYPSPLPSWPLPRGYFFGMDDGTKYSVSGKYRRRFKGVEDRQYIRRFATQLIERGWDVGKGRRWLTKYGNDGIIGAEYAELIDAFERDQRLVRDRKLGPVVWNAASRNPIT